jgi:diacylglycerol kinase (ATP)
LRTQIIVNGSRRKALKRALDLNSRLNDSLVLETKHQGHALELAERACGQCELLVSVGGDGMLHEVVNGVMKQPDFDLRPAIAVLKAGTGNDFARNLSYSSFPELLAKAIREGNFGKLDLGLIQHGNGESIYLVNAMDAGFGYDTVFRIRKTPALVPRPLVFPIGILSTFLTYKASELECIADNFHFSGKCLTAVVANGPWFGGGIGIAPEAQLNDGYLDLTIVGNVGMTDFLRHLPALKKAEKINHPEVIYIKTKEVKLIGKGGFEVDGELPVFSLPVHIKVVPSAVKLLV